MKTIIKNFIRKLEQNELLLGYKDGIVRLEKEGNKIVIEYKDNDMSEFSYAAELNVEDVNEKAIVAMIIAFIEA